MTVAKDPAYVGKWHYISKMSSDWTRCARCDRPHKHIYCVGYRSVVAAVGRECARIMTGRPKGLGNPTGTVPVYAPPQVAGQPVNFVDWVTTTDGHFRATGIRHDCVLVIVPEAKVRVPTGMAQPRWQTLERFASIHDALLTAEHNILQGVW